MTSATFSDLKNALDENQWTLASTLIASNPYLCRKRYSVHFVTDGNEVSDVLPIHHACSKMTVPLSLIQAMISAYPESTQEREYTFRRTCLHIALLKCLPDSIISALIEACPSAIKVQDRFGRVPLHYACSKLRSYDLIKKMIMPFPQCILAPDNKNWTAFHVAVTKNTDSDIIEFMMSLFPEVVMLRTRKGLSPLELLMDEDDDGRSYGGDTVMPVERKTRLSRLMLEKIDEFNDRPEARNYMEAIQKPTTPPQLNPYGIV